MRKHIYVFVLLQLHCLWPCYALARVDKFAFAGIITIHLTSSVIYVHSVPNSEDTNLLHWEVNYVWQEEKQLSCQSWSLCIKFPIPSTLTGHILLICHPNALSCNPVFLVLSSNNSRHQVTIMRVFSRNPNMVMIHRSSTTPNKLNRHNSLCTLIRVKMGK